MEWSLDFESGLADIDVQHRYIFALLQRVNQLDDAVQQIDLREVAEELVRLAKCHFGCEERLMESYNYPDASKHQVEHANLLSEVGAFLHNDIFQARQLALFVCHWLVSHTMLEDRQLARHVLNIRAKAMGMSVSEFADSVKISGLHSVSIPSNYAPRRANGE